MAPIRGGKKKRKVEWKEEETILVPEEGSDEWWDLLSKKIAGNPSFSPSQGLDNFRHTFKMSKRTFEYICSLVKENVTGRASFTFPNGNRLSLHDLVAIALRRLSSGNSLISIGDCFGTHHSTVSQVTWRFVEAIEKSWVDHVRWPSTEQEMTNIKSKFESIRGLPNCCGAIDTTHITMQLTSSDHEAEQWLDSQKNYSMTLQAIVDPNLKFRDIVVGWPGKMTDPSVLQNSNFFINCQKGEKLNGSTISLPDSIELREYIVGDTGFPLLPWLITPYQGDKLSNPSAEFNERLLATHSVARKALTRLKEEWRMIRGDMWRPDKHKLPRFILACCILHNIVIDMEDGNAELLARVDHDPRYKQEVCAHADKEGSVLRNKLREYFSGR